MSDLEKLSKIMLAMSLLAATALGASIGVLATEDGVSPIQECDSLNLTYYKTAVNGSAFVTGPTWAQCGGVTVNVTIKPCREYRYATDEPHICEDAYE